MNDRKYALILLGVFLAAYFIPFSVANVQNAVLEAFLMLQEYAREHILCRLGSARPPAEILDQG